MRNPILVGDRVYLRPLETSDAPLLARYTAEETETFYDTIRIPQSPLTYAHWIRELHKHEPPEEVMLAVCLKSNDHLIGSVGVQQIDWIARTGETKIYLMDVNARGQGYGPEAKHLLLEYCFDHLQLHILYSYVWAPNERSAAAVRRQGYKEAGRIKTLMIQDGKFYEWIMFDVKRDEWIAARDAYRARLAERATNNGSTTS